MDSIRVKDFRCFRDEQTVRLAPLTLLVGDNSTGKTSFMAMIVSLCDLAYGHMMPDFQDEPYDLGSFEKIAHKITKAKQAETFEGGFSVHPKGGEENDKLAYYYNAIFGNKNSSPVPIKRSIVDGEQNRSISIDYVDEQNEKYSFKVSGRDWEIKIPSKLKYKNLPVRYRLNNVSTFYDMFSYIDPNGASKSNDFDIFQGKGKPPKADIGDIKDFLDNFERMKFKPYASAPVRSKPRRDYRPSHVIVDSEGYFTPMYLNRLFLDNEKEWKNLKNAIENFGVEAGLFHEISIQPLESDESGRFVIRVRKFSASGQKGPWHNLIDVGYGVSQILPVITELLSDDAPEMFLLQQPEVHLHPSAQAALGSLFCKIADNGPQILVETHSDHIIDRVRMDIRDSTTNLNPGDVLILYFERSNMGVKIHSLEIDEEGNILNAPRGYRQFFLEETRRSLGL